MRTEASTLGLGGNLSTEAVNVPRRLFLGCNFGDRYFSISSSQNLTIRPPLACVLGITALRAILMLSLVCSHSCERSEAERAYA